VLASVVRRLDDVVRRLGIVVRRLGVVVSRLSAVVRRLDVVVRRLDAVVRRLSAVVRRLSAVVSRLDDVVRRLSAVVLRLVGADPVEVGILGALRATAATEGAVDGFDEGNVDPSTRAGRSCVPGEKIVTDAAGLVESFGRDVLQQV
jgi:hypothetical protein